MNLRNMIEKIIEKYNDSFIVITITAIYDKINILKGKYSLQKNKSLGNVIVLNSPPLFDKGYTIEDARKQRAFPQEQINNFTKKMEDAISKENLLAMYNNLHNLNVKESDFTLIILSVIKRLSMGVKKGAVGGFYSPSKNKIVVYSPKGDALINKYCKLEGGITLESEYTHELLHMSSTIRKKNKICSGFNHCYIAPYVNFSIGMGINEGYTDLLNERIFNAKNNGGLYEIYKIISELVENTIGKDKMTHLYFTANLKGLISELSRYIEPNETKKFIINLDFMVKNPDKINEIIEYLFKLYNSKIQNEVAIGKITNEEVIVQYGVFKSKLVRLSEVFNKWLKTKRENTIDTIQNLDINSILGEQQLDSARHSRGSINIAGLLLVVNFLFLVITIIYFLCL